MYLIVRSVLTDRRSPNFDTNAWEISVEVNALPDSQKPIMNSSVSLVETLVVTRNRLVLGASIKETLDWVMLMSRVVM